MSESDNNIFFLFSLQRDAEHRESLSTALRTLRADSLRQTDNITRLHERFTEAQRKVHIADAEEAALRAQLKTAEGTIHKLKDEAARTKKLVAETRSACANEVRKRDRQIEGLKKAAAEAGKTRGERKSSGITTIQVTGEFGGDAGAVNTVSTSDEDYTLRNETNEFLAQLASSLSEENETLLALLRRMNTSLKSISGWDKSTGDAVAKGDGMAVTLTANAEDLATDIDGVLAHLHTTLTNPAYVLAEDVNKELSLLRKEIEVRDEALNKMVVRWRDAVHLLDSWRRRMAADGRSVDMEELKMGLRLSPIRVQRVRETAHNEPLRLATLLENEGEDDEQQEEQQDQDMELTEESDPKPVLPSPAESLHLVPAPEAEPEADVPAQNHAEYDFDSDSESSIFQDDVDIDIGDIGGFKRPEPKAKIPSPSVEDESESSASVALPQPPTITPLEETHAAGNRKPVRASTAKSRKHLLDGQDAQDEDGSAPVPPTHGTHIDVPPYKRQRVSDTDDLEGGKFRTREPSARATQFNSSLDEALLSKTPPQSTNNSKDPSRVTAERAPAKAAATPASARTAAATRSSRRVADAKRTTPGHALAGQRTATAARATAATASSAARTAPSSSRPEASRTRAAAPSPTVRGAMPPPVRPTRATRLTPTAKSTTPAVPPENRSPAKEQKRPSVPEQQEENPSPKPTKQATAAAAARESTRPTSSASPATRSPNKTNDVPLPPLSRTTRLATEQSPVTVAGIAAKLAASEREASAARVRAKLRAARLAKANAKAATASVGGGDTGVVDVDAAAAAAEKGDPTKRDRPSAAAAAAAVVVVEDDATGSEAAPRGEKAPSALIDLTSARDGAERAITIHSSSPHKPKQEQQPQYDNNNNHSTATTTTTTTTATKPRKREVRSRAEKVASRRRSTLSPWELQSLIAGEVEVPPPPPPAPVETSAAETQRQDA